MEVVGGGGVGYVILTVSTRMHCSLWLEAPGLALVFLMPTDDHDLHTLNPKLNPKP